MPLSGSPGRAGLDPRARARCVVVACGRGNNGGDGWAIARLLRDRVEVAVVSTGSPREGSDAAINARIAERLDIEVIDAATPDEIEAATPRLENALLVDALLGTASIARSRVPGDPRRTDERASHPDRGGGPAQRARRPDRPADRSLHSCDDHRDDGRAEARDAASTASAWIERPSRSWTSAPLWTWSAGSRVRSSPTAPDT